MTVILKPEEIKEQGRKAEEERKLRTTALEAEETRLVNRVNLLREEEQAVRKATDDAVQKMRNEYAAEKCELEVELEPLRKERADLMKPIEDVRKEADDRNAKSKEREDAVAKREADLEGDKKAFGEYETERMEKLADRAEELDERGQNLAERDVAAKKQEEAAKASAQALVGRWAEYHAAADAFNGRVKDVEEREQRASTAEKANQDRAGQLDERERGLEGRERLLRSNYQALEEAKKHLGVQ